MKKIIKFFPIFIVIGLLGCSINNKDRDNIKTKSEPEEYTQNSDTEELILNNYDVCSPFVEKTSVSSDVTISEERFREYYNLEDIFTENMQNEDVTNMIKNDLNSSFLKDIQVVRNVEVRGYEEFIFYIKNNEIFKIKNKEEIYWAKADYFQAKDIDNDGKEEILVAFCTHNNTYFVVTEFYVFGEIDGSWKRLLSYDFSDDDYCITKLLNETGYEDMQVGDVIIGDNGLEVSLVDGEMIGDVFYPKGYIVTIKY